MECDVLVVGGGTAAVTAAAAALQQGARVCLAVKGTLGAVGRSGAGASACGSTFAGVPRILAAGEPYDADARFRRVVAAGLGLADRELARVLVQGVEPAARMLRERGIVFGKPGPVALGAPIVGGLEPMIRASGAQILEHAMVVDLFARDGGCVGAVCLQEPEELFAIRAPAVVLATGGNALLFRHHVHPPCVTGDGYAMALRAGAQLVNMEFMQIFFATPHPTRNLVHVWRGDELGQVANACGHRFLPDYLPQGIALQECVEQNLRHAPFSTRDRASRYLGIGIVKEIQGGRGTPHDGVFLPIPRPRDAREREQNEFLRFRGVDTEAGTIELTMAHQCSNGGIRIGSDGMSGVPGLFAAGECTSGMHGADRLGGHMLASCLVFGAIAGASAARWAARNGGPDAREVQRLAGERMRQIAGWRRADSGAERAREGGRRPAQMLEQLQRAAWNDALTVRSEQSLTRFLRTIESLRGELDAAEPQPGELRASLELRNLLLVGEAVGRAALMRRESRGGHYREDCPNQESAPIPRAIAIRREPGGALALREEVIDPEWDAGAADVGTARWG